MTAATRTVTLAATITATIEVTADLRASTGLWAGEQHLTEDCTVVIRKADAVIARGSMVPVLGHADVAAKVGTLGISTVSHAKIAEAVAEARGEVETPEIAAYRAAQAAAARAADAEMADLEAFQRRVQRGMDSNENR